jgi:hypothetical protein
MIAPPFGPTPTLSVMGIVPEASTIIASPVYASPQAYLIRITGYVSAAKRTWRAHRGFFHSTVSCRAADPLAKERQQAA